MLQMFFELYQHLSSNTSASWLLIIIVISIVAKRLSPIVFILLALLSDKVNTRLIKLMQAAKKETSKR